MRILKNWKKQLKIAVIALVALPFLLVGCAKIAIMVFAPKPPPFPFYKDRQAVIAEAQRISDQLEAYIKDWLDGKVPAELPDRLIPVGVDTNALKHFVLRRPDEVSPELAWPMRPAEQIDFKRLHGLFPDPHCTYLVSLALFAPFGSKVVIEGEYPHSRFFDIQITPSFFPEGYHNGYIGIPEVSIVDADIDPLPGNVNPFRVGADRSATNRSYRVTFALAMGNPVALNPQAFKPPVYRAPGNHRVGGAILYRGPWLVDKKFGRDHPTWDLGNIWIRYYAPDKSRGPLAGVPRPRIHYELADGRAFYIEVDASNMVTNLNRTRPAKTTPPHEAGNSQEGWVKQFGIFRVIVAGIANSTKLVGKDYVRRLDKGVSGRGQDMPPPGNYEPSATCCTYINYLCRGMSLGQGKVGVLTGTLPTTPHTRDGEPTMEAAQARYWSLTGYDQIWRDNDGVVGAAVHSVMDDEIITDARHRYIIVFSREEDRPKNATAENGVTWVNWGPTSEQSWTLRWMSVAPEWTFEKTPDERNLDWRTDWASTNFDHNLIGNNSTNGFLGEYQPIVHYLRREQFEQLGSSVSAADVPPWHR
jgi:hypothetical protein